MHADARYTNVFANPLGQEEDEIHEVKEVEEEQEEEEEKEIIVPQKPPAITSQSPSELVLVAKPGSFLPALPEDQSLQWRSEASTSLTGAFSNLREVWDAQMLPG